MGNPLVFMPGDRFGMLVVVGASASTRHGRRWWIVRCDCGRVVEMNSNRLRNRNRSCGCASWRTRGDQLRTHGRRYAPEYSVWCAMRRRCFDPRVTAYKWYGARGIVVCDRWRDSFENFLSDMGARPSPRHSIDRIDNDGPYSPDNCRWSTNQQQFANTRQVKLNPVSVCLARHMGRRGARVPDIAWAFGISDVQVRNVLRRRSWLGDVADLICGGGT